jgi:hypothetical protein
MQVFKYVVKQEPGNVVDTSAAAAAESIFTFRDDHRLAVLKSRMSPIKVLGLFPRF